MPMATANGIKFHYQQVGTGTNVILIHGMGGNMSVWHANTTLVNLMKEFRVTIYDLRGHGYSDFVESGYTSADMAHDLNGLMESINLEKAYLVGHSFGGLIGLQMASLYPERVSGLVLAEASIPSLLHLIDLDKWPYRAEREKKLREIDPRLPNLLDGFNMYLLEYRLRNASNDETLPLDDFGMRKGLKRIAKRVLKIMDVTTAKKDMRAVAGLSEEKICQIYQPVLALYGQFSPLMYICNYLKVNLPNCKMVAVPEAGHLFPARLPELFVRNIREFLISVERGIDFKDNFVDNNEVKAELHASKKEKFYI